MGKTCQILNCFTDINNSNADIVRLRKDRLQAPKLDISNGKPDMLMTNPGFHL